VLSAFALNETRKSPIERKRYFVCIRIGSVYFKLRIMSFFYPHLRHDGSGETVENINKFNG